MAIILDTETTGLLAPRLAANELQPQIIEIYAGKFCEKTFEIVDEFETFVKPITAWGDQILLEDPINNLKHITRITGIYDYMLNDAPTFDQISVLLKEFCEDEDLIVGHNIMFDLEVIKHNYLRIQQQELIHEFARKHCTVEMSYWIEKKRLKLGQLYQHATGKVMENAHRAKGDVTANLVGYKWLIENEI